LVAFARFADAGLRGQVEAFVELGSPRVWSVAAHRARALTPFTRKYETACATPASAALTATPPCCESGRMQVADRKRCHGGGQRSHKGHHHQGDDQRGTESAGDDLQDERVRFI
jgi:hypothetical protein